MNNTYAVLEAQSFWDSVATLRQDDPYKAQLVDTMMELRTQPFHNPRLTTHDVGAALNGKKIFSSDVGGRRSDRRLVWQKIGRGTIVLLKYGTHAVQEQAKRMQVDFDREKQLVTVFEMLPGAEIEQDYSERRLEAGRLFMAWTDDELADFGFTEPIIEVLRPIDSEAELVELADHMPDLHFEKAYNLVAHGHADGVTAAGAAEPEPVEAEEPETDDAELELEEQLNHEQTGAQFRQSEPAFLTEILTKPIEDWMVFLHPEQKAVVQAIYSGPARVRGAAGTGKTVVGLHRAAWLARRNRGSSTKPVLFTTFIKSLPPVFEALYFRMPEARSGEVEFIHIDRIAHQLCRAAGDEIVTAQKDIDAAFATAFKRSVFPGTPLHDAGFTRDYLRGEITVVIKGRGIDSKDVYSEIDRTGRRAPMRRAHREQVWDLMLEWYAEMAKRGTVDFSDVILRARDHARRKPARYSSAIIDEAQDLTLVGLQLVRALVSEPDGDDPPNGLLVLGDGAQRIYAGGFTLGEAGVEVRGRTTVLRTNYRNTTEILAAATSVAGDVEIEDLDEHYRRGGQANESRRHGPEPKLIETADIDHQYKVVADRIDELTRNGRIGHGDVAVLLPTNRLVKRALGKLGRADVAVEELNRYEGKPTGKVKVGTYHRAKGLEFKAVFLPELSEGVFPRAADPGQSEAEAEEAAELAVAQLYVAMTRARDQLIVLHDGRPSPVLTDSLDRFELAPA